MRREGNELIATARGSQTLDSALGHFVSGNEGHARTNVLVAKDAFALTPLKGHQVLINKSYKEQAQSIHLTLSGIPRCRSITCMALQVSTCMVQISSQVGARPKRLVGCKQGTLAMRS